MLIPRTPIIIDETQRREYLAFALTAVEEAGRESLPYFRTDLTIENKLSGDGFDPVTQADRAVEELLRSRIMERYPEHGIFGEEFGEESGNGLTWVIDPIDGTRAFMSGMLHWGVLVALFDGLRPVIGVMHQPYTEEFWWGDGASSQFRRGRATRTLRTRRCDSLRRASLLTTSPQWFTGVDRGRYERLERAVRTSRYGGDCYIYAMVAMGQADLATDGSLNPYDIQALIPIIEGAGGIVCTYDGQDASMGGTVIAAGSPELQRLALEVLAD